MQFSDTYISRAPLERQSALTKLRDILRDTLVPLGFEECENYGMIGYVVPHSLYPAGYHCDPSLPLPFVALANQKGGIHLYHMGIYADLTLLTWWQEEYAKLGIGKLDMGKSCIRFKVRDKAPLSRGDAQRAEGFSASKIPYDLIRDLMTRIDARQWIEIYERELNK